MEILAFVGFNDPDLLFTISTYEPRFLLVPLLREKQNSFTVFYFKMLGLWYSTGSDLQGRFAWTQVFASAFSRSEYMQD